VIRRATLSDAAEIARVHLASMQAAYAEHEMLANRTFEERYGIWRNALEQDRHVLVAEEDGEIVAFAAIGPARDEGADVGEIYAIYAHPDVWGRGVGRRLIEAATAALSSAGFAEATLWVLDTNDRARRFYERAGWSHDGGVKFEDRLPGLRQVRYRRALARAGGGLCPPRRP
jgi:ribosomal protein S18 acetylase RimI-like enzyme